MSTAAAAQSWCFATVTPRSRATVVASLASPTPSSSSSSNSSNLPAPFRPRLIRSTPVFAAPVALAAVRACMANGYNIPPAAAACTELSPSISS
ncbi:hypothetical protein GUJ93_ZPchr0001g29502 [Zizania palustris]|uniref:Uncharacterized protein n=1 Tax=Zizania palustris TaxID=103762 RepID=A0A8J5SEE4_ZIZPA|nr:hypothetical protein GUJ93_ZPchr0001g29502 [Zizania palustris]